jgi:hypothetical protein
MKEGGGGIRTRQSKQEAPAGGAPAMREGGKGEANPASALARIGEGAQGAGVGEGGANRARVPRRKRRGGEGRGVGARSSPPPPPESESEGGGKWWGANSCRREKGAPKNVSHLPPALRAGPSRVSRVLNMY